LHGAVFADAFLTAAVAAFFAGDFLAGAFPLTAFLAAVFFAVGAFFATAFVAAGFIRGGPITRTALQLLRVKAAPRPSPTPAQ
jgi:hypothetical protein